MTDVLAELNAVADALNGLEHYLCRYGTIKDERPSAMASRLRAVAAQIAEREAERTGLKNNIRELEAELRRSIDSENKAAGRIGELEAERGVERERAIAEAVREAAAEVAEVADLDPWYGRAIAKAIRALDLAPILAAEESREPSPTERGSR